MWPRNGYARAEIGGMSKVRTATGMACAKSWWGRDTALGRAVERRQMWPEQEEPGEELMETWHDGALGPPGRTPVAYPKGHQKF